MDWKTYQSTFKRLCTKRKISKENQEILLQYSHNLWKRDFPIIFDIEHLSLLVGYSEELFYAITNDTQLFYHSFLIPKKNGKKRLIREPYPTLKEIQYWILNNILLKHSISKYAKAYIKNKGLIDNVKFHKQQNVIIKLDVKNFFESITYFDVYSIFLRMGYVKSVANMLARLCCLDEKLPQGAPTSPCLSNIFCILLDKRIGSYITKLNFRYTRYSDDITISGDIKDSQIKSIIDFCDKTLSDFGLKLHKSKTKILRQSNCQYVTGVVLNNKISAGTKQKKKIRQSVYYIKKYGLESHMEYLNINKQNYLSHLLGKINWVLYLEKGNKEFIEYKREIINLIKEFL